MTSSNRRRSSTPPSDAPDSRERILVAAASEFRQKGLAGARVDEIARIAGCNKNLIYYYFNDKSGLYAESLKRMIEQSHARMDALEEGSRDLLDWLRRQAGIGSDIEADWRRLWLWEALDGTPGSITLRDERTASFRLYQERIEEAQASGRVRADLAPAMIAVSLLAMANFPQMFPQVVELITGNRPDDPRFQEMQDDFFLQFVAFLTPPDSN
ncbi:TetR/AcrR family transcriptional regulator [Blastococcus sp. URHD0036]|uniref:TetR/AcrR family transcriptional regulator n=1 Tax=Blastococcus sp. URHD0036 TaxID=1380356 RepID=UPI00068F37F7|nr:TetR/AcrR family transcriptional regulator [Blastococcus sp. URHD0036]